MNKLLTLIIMVIVGHQAPAAQVTIIITSIPANTPAGDNIYIAGSFNGWSPGNQAFILHPNTFGQPQIVVTGSGSIQFKFTRGSWQKVEGNATGGYLPNRTFTFGSADTLRLSILSWEDLGGSGSTAASNVSIMNNAFLMPQLNRTRRIWIYKPPDYETTTKHYPVLYMHDGQNLFDLYTSFAGEWQVDETLNALFANGKSVPIVVGIDNGGTNRIAEYTPWSNPQYGGGQGHLYARFIVETLKPYIDQNYRTLPQRENTGVMGSSLGGLISHYIGLKYQHVFSKAGVFSPSFWFSDSSYVFAYHTGKTHPMGYYMMGGTSESSGLVQQMTLMNDTLLAAGFNQAEILLKMIPGGQHNEQLWRSQFGPAYEWLFLQTNVGTRKFGRHEPIQLKVINDRLFVNSGAQNLKQSQLQVKIISLNGQVLFQGVASVNESLLLPDRLKGLYIITVQNEQICFSTRVFIH